MNKKKHLLICILFIILSWDHLLAETISVEEEKKLGEQFIVKIFNSSKIIKDYELNKYINCVGQKIVKTLEGKSFNYNFHIIDSDDYNAFASLAGYIFVNRGFILAMEGEEELAGILAHEIAHSYLRHIALQIEKSNKVGAGMFAGLLAGILLASSSSSMDDAAVFGTIAAGQSTMLSYSREHERQADQVGLKQLAMAGYEVDGLLDILEKLKRRSIYGDIPVYLQTHPMLDDRISYLKTAKSITKQNEKRETDNFIFKLMQARLIALYRDKLDALNYFEQKIKENTKNPIFEYGYSIVLAKLNREKEAKLHIDKAIKSDKENLYFLRAKLEILTLCNKNKEVISFSENLTKTVLDDPKINFFIAKAYINEKEYKKALKNLTKINRQDDNYNEAFYLISTCYGNIGKIKEAYNYLSLYYKKEHNPQKASFYQKKSK